MQPQIIPAIMCGGAGTRLWPLSRESMPKQFVSLVGPESTFQQVLARVSDQDLFARPIVVTSADFRFVVAEQLRERGIDADIVLEPVRRDSGPAVAVSAELAAERNRDALVLVLAADHVVRKPEEFREACRRAAAAAADGRIVAFGIEPTHPATNYGYVRPGAKLNGAAVHAVDAFVEKPDAATAASYLAEGYLWNSGNFLFHAATMLAEIERFEPAMAEAAKAAVHGLTRDLDFLRLAAEPFARAPKKSIDYAVMERTKLAAVVPADLGWSDVGSWSTVWEVLDHDQAGNATEGPVVLLNSRNSLVRSEESVLTTVVGLDDVIVVSTSDAVLVSARAQAEQVKTLVEKLKAQNHRAAIEHRRMYRPWGYYQDIDLAPRYRVKRIVVKPGNTLSLQKHFHRSEHWVVVKGTAEVTVASDVRTVHENESIYIPIGSVHRLANPGKIPLELIEVQVGSYLGEDDIVRLDDVYGRGYRQNSNQLGS
jgi:mannose-1-phosphate guanylyltransferase / mannose-6-phosphate isomerase